MTRHELRSAISAALNEPGVQHINSDAFWAACDKHGIEGSDLADAISERGLQAKEDREYDHWGAYDRH